jgi:hypothetical protein
MISPRWDNGASAAPHEERSAASGESPHANQRIDWCGKIRNPIRSADNPADQKRAVRTSNISRMSNQTRC